MAGFTGNEARRIIELIITGDSAGAVRAIEKTTLASAAARRKIEEDNARQQRTFERLAGSIDGVGRSLEKFNISRVGRAVGGMSAIGRGALATTRHLGDMARAMDRISTSRFGNALGVLHRSLRAVGTFGLGVGAGLSRGVAGTQSLLLRRAFLPGMAGGGVLTGLGGLLGLGALGGAGFGAGVLGAGMFESVSLAAKHHNTAAKQSMQALKGLQHTGMQAVTRIGGAMAPIVTQAAHAFMPIIRSLTKAILPLSHSMAKVVPPLTSALGKFLPQLVSGLVQIAPQLVNAVTKALPLAMTIFQGVGSLLSNALTTLLPPVEKALQAFLPPLVSAINMLMPPMAAAINALMPPLTQVMKQALPPLIKVIQQIVPPLARALGRVVEVLAPALGKVILALAPILTRMVTTLAPVIARLITFLVPPLVNVVKQLAPVILKLIKELVPPLVKFVKNSSSVILELAKTMIKLLPPLTTALTKLTPFLVSALKDFNKGFGRVTHPRRLLSSAGHTAAHDFWSEAPWGSNPFGLGSIFHSRGGLIRHLAAGGPVGTDTVPAWLTPGEFVLSRAASQRVGLNALNALNAGTPLSPERIVIEPQPVTIRLDSRTLTEAVARYTLKRNARGSTSLVGGGIVTGTTFS